MRTSMRTRASHLAHQCRACPTQQKNSSPDCTHKAQSYVPNNSNAQIAMPSTTNHQPFHLPSRTADAASFLSNKAELPVSQDRILVLQAAHLNDAQNLGRYTAVIVKLPTHSNTYCAHVLGFFPVQSYLCCRKTITVTQAALINARLTRSLPQQFTYRHRSTTRLILSGNQS